MRKWKNGKTGCHKNLLKKVDYVNLPFLIRLSNKIVSVANVFQDS